MWPANAECCVARQLRERIGMGGEDGGCVAGYMHVDEEFEGEKEDRCREES